MLFDKTGSATRNTILRNKYIKKHVSGESLGTPNCSYLTAERFGLNISIVDFSDVFDTSPPFKKDIKVTWNAIILVLNKGRYTEEEQKFVQYIKDNFGEKIFQYLIVISTKKYYLDRNKSGLPNLSTLIRKCEGRVMVFDNKSKEDMKDKEVKALLTMILKIPK